MTDRAEIERLINQTGRTLEGLPERYEPEEAMKACKRGKERGWTLGEVILNQSDVIELLVCALRDALAKVPKWISVEEHKPKGYVSVQVYMTDAGDFPSVREGYYVDEDRFYIPALHEFHPVSHWKPFDEPPEEDRE